VITERRWVARGGRPGEVLDIAVWAVPFGILGGRLYHVLTTPQPYFGEGGDPLRAFAIWEGGLGIWGAIALGGVGAWIACRRRGIPLPAFGDAIAPALLVAQAIGRLGNWFNQELFGRPTTLPWALEIDPVHRPAEYQAFATFHPAFLYELLWNLAAAAVVVWADRRFRLSHGRAFALYVALYCAGRLWIELLRIDDANRILGVRLNVSPASWWACSRWPTWCGSAAGPGRCSTGPDGHRDRPRRAVAARGARHRGRADGEAPSRARSADTPGTA
jgi:prolipoprotein diacylglyceryl transferase